MRFLKVLCINVIILTVLLVIIDFAIRSMNIYFPSNTMNVVVGKNHIMNIPKSYSKAINNIEVQNVVKYNNLGFHDLDKKLDSSALKYAFFGDSYVEGAQLDVKDLFTTHLAKHYIDRGVSIFNFGISGTGPAYQFILYRYLTETGLKTQFDHLYVAFYAGNDFSDSDPYVSNHHSLTFVLDSAGQVNQTAKKYSLSQPVFRSFRSHSAIVNYLYIKLYVWKRMNILKKKTEVKVAGAKRNSVEPRTFDNTTALARLYHNWSEITGKDRFTVLIIDRDKHAAADNRVAELEKQLDAFGIRHLSLNMRNEEATHYNNGHGHYNEQGHLEWFRFMRPEINSLVQVQTNKPAL